MPSILTITIIIAVCWICYGLTSGRTATSLKISAEGDEDAPDSHVETILANRE